MRLPLIILIASALVPTIGLNANNNDELSIFDETDALLTETEFLSEEDDESEEKKATIEANLSSPWVFWSSASLGAGYTNNVYKGANRLESFYSITDADLIINYLPDAPWIVQLYSFIEWKGYEGPETINDEWVVLSQLKADRFFDRTIVGIQFTYFYGDMFFDSANDLFELPAGSRIIFHQPKMKLGLTYSWSTETSILFSVYSMRNEYNVAEFNQWVYGSDLRFETKWNATISSVIQFVFEKQYSDTRTIQDEFGNSAGDDLLVRDRFDIESEVEWTLGTPLELTITLLGALTFVQDNGEQYEDYQAASGVITLSGRFGLTEFELEGAYAEYNYDKRRWLAILPDPLFRNREQITLGLSRSLPWELEGTARIQWERLQSQINVDNFESLKVELIFNKAF